MVNIDIPLEFYLSKHEISGNYNFKKYKKRISKLFRSLNLDLNGLEQVKEAFIAEDLLKACKELLVYYRNVNFSKRVPLLRRNKIHRISDNADDLLKDIIYGPGSKGEFERLGQRNNMINWFSKGPNNDIEWSYHINRHFFAIPLVDAYKRTKNDIYVKCCNDLLLDWFIQNECPKIRNDKPNWRGMEVASRILISWPYIFYELIHSKSFSDLTLILLLENIPRHANYLKKWHAYAGNHLITQMRALGAIGFYWSEFKDAEKWITFAKHHLEKEIHSRQVYPDGLQKELSTHVHMITLTHFNEFDNLLRFNNRLVSHVFESALIKMWEYIVFNLKPNRENTINNDSWIEDYKPEIRQAAIKFNRKDWLYIISEGKEGIYPDKNMYGNYSKIFPWGGHAIIRNNWNSSAQYCFFDYGPSGISPTHLHKDKLHVSIYAGRDLLVDSGAYRLKRDKWRNLYYNSSFGHNTIIIDGCGQKIHRFSVSHPVKLYHSGKDFEYIEGNYKGKYSTDIIGVAYRGGKKIRGKTEHHRGVYYKHDKYWIIIDHIKTDRPREICVLWHFHPDCKIMKEGKSVLTSDIQKFNLNISPSNQLDWNIRILKGQETPRIQGWYTYTYGIKEPSNCVEYHTKIKQTSTFIWIIYPRFDKILPVKDLKFKNHLKKIEIQFTDPYEGKKEIIDIETFMNLTQK